MPRYQGRHSARHAAPRPQRGGAGSSFVRSQGFAAALVVAAAGSVTLATQATGQGVAGPTQLTLDPSVVALADAQGSAASGDTAALASGRTEANAALSARQAAVAEAARKQAAALLKARREAQARADRERQRQAVLADARNDPRAAARALLPEFGFSDGQWSCLDNLWQGESGWKYTAENPSSGAYGIPQSLPGSKMASVASDWRTNPVTQIRWGLQYIKSSYGTPCNAWNTWQSRWPHWY